LFSPEDSPSASFAETLDQFEQIMATFQFLL